LLAMTAQKIVGSLQLRRPEASLDLPAGFVFCVEAT
jgi:hypothetical protein